MKKKGNDGMGFVLKRIAVVLLLAIAPAGAVLAGETPSTVAVQGRPPMVLAPSNRAEHAVDFDWAGANSGHLSTGDTLTLKYFFVDPDGDMDAAHTTVKWSYVKPDGSLVAIPSTSAPGTDTEHGTSVIVIPPEALGATAIHVELDEVSTTGNPRGEKIIIVQDTSLTTDPTGPGGGGDLVTPPGPIQGGSDIIGSIFLASDNPTAGSGALDYARSDAHPKVGETYVFRAWVDTNGNGVWDAGETDLTASMGHIQWLLEGDNSVAAGESPVVMLSATPIAGATTDSYRVPVNSASHSGAVPGDQGFGLKVEFMP